MQRIHKLVAVGVVVALAAVAVGVITVGAATNTRIVVVNGYIGQRVNVCLDGELTKAGLRTGQYIVRGRDNGQHRLKFVAAGRGCGAKKIAARNIGPSPGGGDYTAVLTSQGPKRIALFDNALLNGIEPEAAGIAIRYAGDLGTVHVFAQELQRQPIEPDPDPASSHAPDWAKGDELLETLTGGSRYRFWATKEGASKRLGTTPFKLIPRGKRTELILIGKKPKNTRFATVKVKTRPGPSPSPMP